MNPPTGSARRASGAAPGTPPARSPNSGAPPGSPPRPDAGRDCGTTPSRGGVAGDGELLASLLRPDGMAVFDGGGKVRAPTGPVHGGRAIAESLLTLLGGHRRPALSAHSVNGRTGLVACCGHRIAAVISLDVTGGRGTGPWIVLNPDKLVAWNQRVGTAKGLHRLSAVKALRTVGTTGFEPATP
ncbi:hypothetical protein ABT065_30035 [Streptomyces sp. NPDC002764]|uniref:hypothetical protein n=1 Tax=Streptomyces sp. NPDC002764 TaxID=3154428 RepID=UPI00331F8286